MLCYIISCYIGNYQPISLHHLSSILITTHHNRYTVFAEKHGAPIHTEGSHPPIMRAAKIARAEKPAKKAARWPDCKILQSSYYLPVSWWKRTLIYKVHSFGTFGTSNMTRPRPLNLRRKSQEIPRVLALRAFLPQRQGCVGNSCPTREKTCNSKKKTGK